MAALGNPPDEFFGAIARTDEEADFLRRLHEAKAREAKERR
jgi:hypothetical protein